MARFYISLPDSSLSYSLGLWKMEENEAVLFQKYPEMLCLKDELNQIKSSSRRLEFLSVRALLKGMLDEIPQIFHDSDGRPFLENGIQISVSHTRGYVAVVLSGDCNVAVDIEYMSDRVNRVADKFLRKDEIAESEIERLVCWCAKETLYKLHSTDKLSFHEMKINELPDLKNCKKGSFIIENIKRGQCADVNYVCNDMFVLTYAVEKSR